MRDRREQGRTQALGFATDARAFQIGDQARAQRSLADVFHHRFGQAALFQAGPLQRLSKAQRGHTQGAALVAHRQAPPLRPGQGIGETAGRLAVALGPIGGAAIERTEAGGCVAFALLQA